MKKPADGEREFAEALLLWNDSGDIAALLRFLRSLSFSRSGRPMPSYMAERLAAFIELLDAKTRKRSKSGRPRGTIRRWEDPNYVAAWLVEHRVNSWKDREGKSRVPDTVRDGAIKAVIDNMRGKHRLSVERIRRILREPKSLRLPK